jgi:hypothetical protein
MNKMKILRLRIFQNFDFCKTSVFLFLLFFTPIMASGQSSLSLDEAVRDCSQYLQSRFPKGTRAALITFDSESRELGEFVLGKISTVLVNGGWFTVVERNAAALENIEREMERHLNFQVTEETGLSIGKQLGAEIIISGSFTRSGQNWRLNIQAFRVESAERVGQRQAENIRPDPAWDPLAASYGAVSSFEKDIADIRLKGPGHYTVTLADNVVLASNFDFSGLEKKIILIKGDSNRRTITSFAESCLFIIPANCMLILGNNITLNGNSRRQPVVYIDNGGKFEMQVGSEITGSLESGVMVCGVFNMTGGTIKGNTGKYGGGVYIDNGGTFAMSGGLISGNTATVFGGGIYISSGGTFIKTGGTVDSTNKAGSYVSVWNTENSVMGTMYPRIITSGPSDNVTIRAW